MQQLCHRYPYLESQAILPRCKVEVVLVMVVALGSHLEVALQTQNGTEDIDP